MRKLLIPGLALLLVLGLSSCDLNIFNSFENIPTYSMDELNDDIADVSNEDGEIEKSQATEKDESTGVVKVNAGVETYIGNIETMIDNDSLPEFTPEEFDTVARNLETVVQSVLDGYAIDLENNPPASFEDFIVGKLGGSLSEEQKQEEAAKIRETVQSAANAAVSVRLEADPDSRNLVSNSTLLLLDLLASDDSRSLSRTLYYDGDNDGTDEPYDIPENLQFRLVESDGTEHVIHFEGIPDNESTPDTNEEGVEIYFETVTSEGSYSAFFDDTDSPPSGYVMPIGDMLNLASEEAGNQDLVAFLELIENLVALEDKGFGVPYLKAESRLQVLEDFMNRGNGSEGDDDRPISDLLAMLEENNIDITKINKVAATFNSIATNARTFASTLEYAEGSTTEIDLASVAPKFKEKTGGALNGKGVDMVTMSILSIAFDYLFDQGADDTRGLFDTAAFHGFLNDTDLISFEAVENGDNDYSIMRIKRVPELLPQLLGYDDESTALNPDNETQMDDIRTSLLVGAGLAAAGTDPLEASTKLERDGARLDKLAALINLSVSTLTDGEYADFEALITSMFTDDSTE